MAITGVTMSGTLEGERWAIMLVAWKDDEDDPGIEEEDWASGASAEEAFARGTLRLGREWEQLEGGAVVAAQ